MLISPSIANEIINRHYNFYDALVDSIGLSIGGISKSCTIKLKCKDLNSDSGWSTVVFELQEVEKFCFKYGRTTFEILSSGIQLFFENELIYLFLDAYPDDEDMPNLNNNTAFICAKKAFFKYDM